MRKGDVDNITEILYEEKWTGDSVKELKMYCKEWDKKEIYGTDLSNLTDDQIERVYRRFKYLYK